MACRAKLLRQGIKGLIFLSLSIRIQGGDDTLQAVEILLQALLGVDRYAVI